MTNLTHSAAHERLADLSLEPVALRAFAADVAAPAGAGDSPLHRHVRECDACRAEIDGWLGLHDTVTAALAGPASPVTLEQLAAAEPITAPPALRSAVAQLTMRDGSGPNVAGAARVAALGGAPVVSSANLVMVPPRRLMAQRWARLLLPLVAVLAVVVAAGGLMLDQSRRLDQARSDTAALAGVTAALDRVMLDPAHRAVALTAADGSTGGSVAWTSHDLVVLATSLGPPPTDAVYRCWIERDGRRSPIGRMYFAEGTGYWTGSLDDWATTSFAAGSTFGISLEPAVGGAGTPAVLAADLGG